MWKPIYRPGDISANRYNFFNAIVWENKSYNSSRLTVYMSPLFWKQQVMETMNYQKMLLLEGLILFAAIYQMDAMLNLLIMHEKEKN